MDNINGNEFGISKSPLDDLNETELQLLLQRPGINESLKMAAQAKLDTMRREFQVIDDNSLGHGNSQVQSKTYSKSLPQFQNKFQESREDNVGYVNIIILMLVTWVTCLLGMLYIYSNIMG